jgi:hypothetical protein
MVASALSESCVLVERSGVAVHQANLVLLGPGGHRPVRAPAARACARRRALLGILLLATLLTALAALRWPGSWPAAGAALTLAVVYLAGLVLAARRRAARPPRPSGRWLVPVPSSRGHR